MNYTIATVLFLAAFVVNRYELGSSALGAALLFFFFLFYGARLGKKILPDHNNVWQTSFGSLIIVCSIMILGAATYYVAFLPNDLWTVFVILTPVAVWLKTPQHKTLFRFKFWRDKRHTLDRASLSLATISIIFLVAIFAVVSNVEIFDAVRSTWERVPLVTLWLFALLFIALAAMAFHGRERSLTLPLIILTAFGAVSIAAIAYPLGFGFDSFLHQATEKHIAEFGTIDPKPFYYIGQYVLVLFTSKAFALPLLLVDRFILPVLAATLLPLTLYFAASCFDDDKRAAIFSTLGVFLVPLSGFIVTTPQGMANLLTFALILTSIPTLLNKKGMRVRYLWIIGASVVAIHPLAGIPAILYLALVTLRPNRSHHNRVRKSMLYATVALGSISLPIVFLVNALISKLDTTFSLASLSPIKILESLNFNLIFQSGYNPFLDFAYLHGANALLLFVIITAVMLWRNKKTIGDSLIALPALTAAILMINYVVMKSAMDFTFLINYERSNYADRLIALIFFFLTPYVAMFITELWKKIREMSVLPKAFVILMLAAMMTSQIYLTYPRRDNYDTSHGFNTGAADFLAAEYIEENAPDDYVVLANQQVAAAAVFQYGFKKYYGDIFYYPIPTGGNLYQIFLEMNERPTRETIKKAMELTGVNTAYYIVNDYWWQSERLIETAKTNSDDWLAIDGGRVHVFRYNHIELK